MSDYTDHLSICPLAGDHSWEWQVTEPLRWEIGKIGSGLFIEIPANFITDLATIPRWVRWLFNPYDPQTAKAACVHDYLLSLKYGQQMAVGEFYAALKADDYPLWKRKLYYWAVTWAIDVW